ncbi:hypothetical protein [Marivirga harenae]|uniref:golvesin C-terminal-like domain-containing protein n=1 Tax=Marivirga harenae TaxID=2010992 RepID=UPI0026DFE4A7|nr:hypothetical protein [Marivirga harenae]WKV12342.1 hypothetical protein Q3Y49_00625 [Marivirga harenae]
MISIKNILTISRFEAKVLWRNWFFRILAIAGIGFLTIFNIAVFSEADVPRWANLANSWMMPYASLALIAIPQAAAVIFLASGLIKKDKKIDTNEVFFVRPISNLDYVFGKALALFKLFFLLNLVFVLLSLVFNITSPYTTFEPLAYVIYPLLTSMPTIVFTTGLSFLLVTLLKNQPITIVLLLGIAGVQLIYYFDQFSNILDFTAFRLSMFTSDISGFEDMEFAIMQRSFYFIAGIALLFITAFFLDRLSSHKTTKLLTGTIGILILGISAFVMLQLWNIRQDPIDLREEMISLNGEWAEVPNITIVSNSIEIELKNQQLYGKSAMKVQNNSGQLLDSIYFTLNPGLAIDQVSVNGKIVEARKNLQIVSINQAGKIARGEEIEVEIEYHGDIKQSAAHLEVDQERYEAAYEYFAFSLQKKYAFLDDDYALLTKDVLWYPDTQIGYNQESSTSERLSFINFQLKVKTQDGQMAISQGESTITDNIFEFQSDYALPQISLVIGDYVKKDITVDSVNYVLYHYRNNDFLTKQLDQLSDTVQFLIADLANEYQDAQKIQYPFKRLQFVETPLQFTAYNKIYESHQAYLQPETVYWPEKGGDIRQFDLRMQLRDMNNQAKRNNQTLSDKQKQANVFNDLIKRVFTKQIGAKYTFDGNNIDDADYSIFPNYYTYNAGFGSEEWPLLNSSIATYLKNEKKAQRDFSRDRYGISFTEECNKLMRESSLEEILSQAEFNKIQKSISLKSQYLFSYLGELVGESNFKSFLFDWVNAHSHQLTSYQELRKALIAEFQLDLDPIIEKVYSETAQAAFVIQDLQKYEVLDGDRKRFQILVEIKNIGDNDGVVEVNFVTGNDEDDDDFWRNKVNEETETEKAGQLSVIRKGETKLLGFVLDEKPDNITINTIISRNIPSKINMSIGPLSKREGATLFEGERIINQETTTHLNELIVDNEDAGFSSFSPIKPTYLKAYLDSRKTTEQEYYGSWDRPYSKWLATTGSDFYGEVIRSAHFARSGSGEKVVTWTPEFKEEGFYDIYTYMKGKNQNEYSGSDGNSKQYFYHYIIKHADGEDNINYNISNAEPGWNFLGSYYFNEEGGSVSLTDECDLRTVYADAIKWVKQ